MTEAFIEFYSMQYEYLQNPAYPVHSFPLVSSGDGISISDDEALLLSPDLYREFGLPYLNRIDPARPASVVGNVQNDFKDLISRYPVIKSPPHAV